MQSPSNSQLKAITHGEGPMLVLAGPGSGKTFVIIQRILYLINHKHIPPERILVISFSKASALELKNRFQKQIQDRNNSQLLKEKPKINNSQLLEDPQKINNSRFLEQNSYNNKSANVSFVTFHACFFHILRDRYHYSTKDILQEKEKREILKTILMEPEYQISSLNEQVEEYLSKISYYKNKGEKELKERENIQFQKIFQSYRKEVFARGKLDFDDMGLLCFHVFKNQPEILQKWRENFSYILIDEYQDINRIQFLNIQLLAAKHENLFVVGDDDQAIYGFRGASPKYMLEFQKYYPKAGNVLLETNFRCGEEIVKAARKVIEKNSLRFQKEIIASKKGVGVFVCQGFENRQKEYSYIGENIVKMSNQDGRKISEIACIYRTNQDMAGLAEYFVRNQIPFVMKEQCNSIFRHFIALDMIAYLQFFLEGKKRSDFVRIMNKPLRYISRNSLEKEQVAWKQLKDYYCGKKYMQETIEELEKNEKWIQKLDLYGVVHYIRKVIGYETYLKEECIKQGVLWEEAKEILEFIHNSVRGMKNLEEWKHYIREYEEGLKNAIKGSDGVQLLTMHSCKGLEFSVVFLPDCNEGKVPHKKAVTKEEIEEERRMFYVAMTRAKERLEILYIEDKQKKHIMPTRFLTK